MVRKANERDLDQILGLYAQLEADQSRGTDLAAARKIFGKIQSYPDYSVYVADLDGKIIGTFALAVMDNLAHMGAPSGLVEDVVVSEDYRHKGIGGQMMTFAMELCRQKGCYKIALSSNIIREGAHRFYESLGFEIHGYSFIAKP